MLLVSATSGEALADNVRSLRDVLRRRTALPLADLVTTAALGRSHGRHRIAVREVPRPGWRTPSTPGYPAPVRPLPRRPRPTTRRGHPGGVPVHRPGVPASRSGGGAVRTVSRRT
ncbi:hypothetical protein ACN24M_37180 [Streptomyces microflavus]